MSEQIRQSKNSASGHPSDLEDNLDSQSLHADALADELEDLLDQIDEVLESNAEEFVKNYVQKGGE